MARSVNSFVTLFLKPTLTDRIMCDVVVFSTKLKENSPTVRNRFIMLLLLLKKATPQHLQDVSWTEERERKR